MTIQIGANDRSREIAMRVHRGLFIEGRVYGTNGSPDRIDVRAREELDRWESRTLSTSDGAFTLGPLIPGRYELTAEGSPTRVWVKAGEKGVELRLNTGGSLDIRVIDASSREECEATVTITRRVEESNESRTLHYPWFDDSQTRGLASGYYDITAITADRRYGEVRDVIVDDGRITKDVVVAVAPCGELRLRCDAPYRSGTVQVMHEGRVMRTATLEPGVDLSIVFPSGRTTVRFVGQGAAGVSEQTFELAPGENRLVVFGE
jgi:hypothetical protein